MFDGLKEGREGVRDWEGLGMGLWEGKEDGHIMGQDGGKGGTGWRGSVLSDFLLTSSSLA